MRIRDFQLERYFGRHEFTARYLLSSSDPETMPLRELLTYADESTRRDWNDLRLGYTESEGAPALREAIAAQYATGSADDVVVFSAPEEAIFHVAGVLLEPGDHFVGITPAYQSSYEVPRALGAEVTLVPLRPGPRWTLDVDELAAALRPNTKLLYLNFPHNPTGAMISAAQLEQIIERARASGTYVFADEVYRGLEHDVADRLPAVADGYERGISLAGMSKAYGLPGLRIGWIACRDDAVRRALIAAKDYTTICASGPSEVLATIAVRAADAIIGACRARIIANKALVGDLMGRWPDVYRWLEPQAGSVCFPELRLPIPISEFAEQLLDERGVLLVPAPIFDADGNFFRVGLGRANLPEALAELEAFTARTGSAAGASR